MELVAIREAQQAWGTMFTDACKQYWEVRTVPSSRTGLPVADEHARTACLADSEHIRREIGNIRKHAFPRSCIRVVDTNTHSRG